MLKPAIHFKENSNFASENFSAILNVSRGKVTKLKVGGTQGKGAGEKGLEWGSASQGAQPNFN